MLHSVFDLSAVKTSILFFNYFTLIVLLVSFLARLDEVQKSLCTTPGVGVGVGVSVSVGVGVGVSVHIYVKVFSMAYIFQIT